MDFGKQMASSCHVTIGTLTEFQAFCESATERASKEIFAQFLERFKFVAIFGNPSVDYTEDWVETISADAAAAVSKPGVYDESRQSCTLTTALEVEIMTSQVGYIDNMQKYVVGAKMTPVTSEWQFEAESVTSAPQDFSLYVAVAYTEILPKELEASGYLSFSLIRGNLFYPFEIKGGASESIVASLSLAIALLASLTLL